MMRFLHYSPQPLTKLRSGIKQTSDHRGTKPNGLWLSVVGEDESDGWKNYCMDKGVTLEAYCTEVILKRDANVLPVQNASDIDRLTNAYGHMPVCEAEFLKSDPNYNRSAICWERVAERFDGIIIAPECPERRQVSHWYYTRDCASACIWRTNAIAELKPVPVGVHQW
jgi:hypothetical protein